MSGGSFDYVSCTHDVGELLNKRGLLESLRDALAQYPDSVLAVAETDMLLNALVAFDKQYASERFSALRNVWFNVEWHHSGDRGPDAVAKALADYNAALAKHVEMDVPLRHARAAVSRMPGGDAAWPGLVALIAGAIAAALEERQ